MVLTNASRLAERVAKVCPIFGVSLKDESDKNTWRIDFKPEATEEQRAAAVLALQGFDLDAEEAKEQAEKLKEEQDARAAKDDVAIKQLVRRTPAQAAKWVEDNVTDLSSAKALLVTLTKAVAVLARRL